MLRAVEEGAPDFRVCWSLASAIADHREHLVRKIGRDGTTT